MPKAFLLIGVSFLCVLPADADTWVKVKSPHFTVISNGNEKEARRVTEGFEQIHAIFSVALPGLRTDSGAETIVIAPKDERTFTYLLPFEKKRAGTIAGEFHKGWEKDHVIVRLDIPDEERNIVYHEYVHKLLHLNFTRMPVWLDEGLAEFFGNTWIRKEGAFIGAPSPRIGLLRSRTPYPLQTILSVGPGSPYYRDEDKVGMFYAESWGLTHFLMFGDNMGNGERMNSYLGGLQKGLDDQKAFQQAFGDRDEIQKKFANYMTRFSFPAKRLDKPPNVNSSEFVGGPMSAAETDARLGSFFTYIRELDLANQRLTTALTEDPKSSLAHENEGFLYFQQGKDEQAEKEFDDAANLDPDDYLALYYQALLRYHGKTDPDSLAKLDAALEKVITLNPRFAPALVVRSQIYVRLGKLQDAYNVALRAQKLEPDRAGYQTNVAAILLLGRNYTNAVKIASTVAARWTASDSAEALAVVTHARRLGGIEQTADEKNQEEEEMKYATDTSAVEGVVSSTSCEKSKPMELVLQTGDRSLNFRASSKSFGLGFSDTIWYGTDHFTGCYHLDGMKAVVRYKPSADQSAGNEMRWLEIRDELIPGSVPPTAN
jgi:tetratricopeptide (TPR) repeat protein